MVIISGFRDFPPSVDVKASQTNQQIDSQPGANNAMAMACRGGLPNFQVKKLIDDPMKTWS